MEFLGSFIEFYCRRFVDMKANKTLKGIEALNMIKKGQIKNFNYSALEEAKYINQLFGIVL
jgi:hypothetical protein